MKKSRKLKSILSLTFLTLLSSCGGLQTAPYTVDTPLWEIGNHSLNDLFEDTDRLEDYQLVSNGDLTHDTNNDTIPDGFVYSSNTTAQTLTDGVASFTATYQYGRLRQDISFNANDLIYYFASVKASSNLVYLVSAANIPSSNAYHSGNNEFQFLSNIQIASGSYNQVTIGDGSSSGWTPISVDYMGAYNINEMITQGIKNDNDVLFSELNDTDIKYQLDAWTESGRNPYLYSYTEAKEVYPELTEQQFIRLSRDYETLKSIPQSIISKFSIDDIIILVISFILWIVGIALAKYTETNWLYAISGLLWFVPLFIVSNIFVIIFSISLMIFSFLYAFVKEE